MSQRLNITDIHREMNEKFLRKSESYEKILEMVYKRMKKKSGEDKLSYFFEVPEYIFGYPLFKLNVCITFLYAELTKNGFLVKYYFPKYLYISWDYDEIKYENSCNQLPYQIPHYKRLEIPFYKKPIALPIFNPNTKWDNSNVDSESLSKKQDVHKKYMDKITDYNLDSNSPEKNPELYPAGEKATTSLLPFLSSGMGKKNNFQQANLKPSGKLELNLF